MTRRQLAARVHAWQRRLGLDAWRLTVTTGAARDRATCHALPEYLSATLHFDLKRIPARELDDFIVHELMHLPSWEAWATAEALARTAFERRMLRERFERLTTELERLARRLAPTP